MATNHSKPSPVHPSATDLSCDQSQTEVGSYIREGREREGRGKGGGERVGEGGMREERGRGGGEWVGEGGEEERGRREGGEVWYKQMHALA